jgi:hypothetical protein
MGDLLVVGVKWNRNGQAAARIRSIAEGHPLNEEGSVGQGRGHVGDEIVCGVSCGVLRGIQADVTRRYRSAKPCID